MELELPLADSVDALRELALQILEGCMLRP